jgi:hypothetical protein
MKFCSTNRPLVKGWVILNEVGFSLQTLQQQLGVT